MLTGKPGKLAQRKQHKLRELINVQEKRGASVRRSSSTATRRIWQKSKSGFNHKMTQGLKGIPQAGRGMSEESGQMAARSPPRAGHHAGSGASNHALYLCDLMCKK